MIMKIHLVIAMFCVCVLGSARATDSQNLEKTWTQARVYAPGNWLPRSAGSFRTQQQYPVIIYFHGCGGISSNNDAAWAEFLSSQGYLVVMPDSFAQSGRTPGCNASTRQRESYATAQVRLKEVDLALERIRNTGWSTGQVFLMGHSQGAWAISAVQSPEISGVILSSMKCQQVQINPTVSILRIGYVNDPWMPVSIPECGDQQEHPSYTRLFVAGREHETAYSRELKTAVRDWLKMRTRQSQ